MKIRYLSVLAAVMIAMLLLFAVGCGKKNVEEEIVSEPVTEPVVTPEPEPEPAPEVTDEVVVPETEEGEDYVGIDELESGDYTQEGMLGNPQNSDTTLAKDLTGTPERFSNFECKADEETGIRYISLKVTNTNEDQEFMISPKGIAKGYNTYFMIRGMVDMDPGCADEQLAPGESTVCTMIGKDDARYGNVVGINRLTIQSPDNDGKTNSEAVVVNCPE